MAFPKCHELLIDDPYFVYRTKKKKKEKTIKPVVR